LAGELSAGRSIESLARELGKHPSTVAYWANKYGLVSARARAHAPRGALDREALCECVERGMSVRQIAAEMDRSVGTIRHWLKRYGLRTRPSHYLRRDLEKPPAIIRECPEHGWIAFHLLGSGRYRCAQCNSDAVSERRRRVKEILVAEAGGCCALCGYDGYAGALQFHHLDPARKRFNVSSKGITRSLDRLREEAGKCVLLCANCHAEVEGGFKALPTSLP
jgi:transposase-like protein